MQREEKSKNVIGLLATAKQKSMLYYSLPECNVLLAALPVCSPISACSPRATITGTSAPQLTGAFRNPAAKGEAQGADLSTPFSWF